MARATMTITALEDDVKVPIPFDTEPANRVHGSSKGLNTGESVTLIVSTQDVAMNRQIQGLAQAGRVTIVFDADYDALEAPSVDLPFTYNPQGSNDLGSSIAQAAGYASAVVAS